MILRYKPGAWIERVGGVMTLCTYDVPTTTSLIVIGLGGSGKSSLINKISKVFDNDKFAPERAQVSYNPCAGDGTYFLQEHMIPKGSTSFCLYDTRSLSGDLSESTEMLKSWIMKGVKHGEPVIKGSGDSCLRCRMINKARQNIHVSSETRKVNFVIFVVNMGFQFLNPLEVVVSEDKAEYTKLISQIFNCPYLSYKDDKPAVVVTHGDLLSISDRTRIRLHLQELLGISASKQIFDIPDSCDTELAVVDLLRYSLERADRHLPRSKAPLVVLVVLLLLLVLVMVIFMGISMSSHA